jgi:DNA recombination-dependent growth factor C
MKNLIIILGIFCGTMACAPATTPTESTNKTIATIISPEAEAKSVTEKMKSVLALNEAQEEKVMMVNVINIKLMKKLRESKETDKMSSTKTKYQSEIKEILDEAQFAKFLVEFNEN